MAIDFVSLFEVIDGIHVRIEIAQDEIDSYSELQGKNDPFEQMLARHPARHCFQRSRAARRLVEALFNTSATLRYFDLALTQSPLQSDEVRKEIRDELVRIAKEEQQFKDTVSRMRRFNHRWRDDPIDNQPEAIPLLNPPKLPRSHYIGFERNELITLLNKCVIPHNVRSRPSLTNKVLQPHNAIPSSSTQKKTRYFRGEMAAALQLALSKAIDPDDYQSVWAALREIAISKSRPFPVIEYISDSEGIKIHDVESPPHGIKFFTKENMRKRIR